MFHTYHKALVVAGLVFCSLSSAFAYSGGSGTPGDPYQIATKADLLDLAATTADYNECFILTADIDMAGEVFTTAIIAADTSSGSGFQGTAFTGTFDGNDHNIANFTIDGGSNSYLGLFGRIYTGGSVKNLSSKNCAVSGTSGSRYVGGLVGLNNDSISNCYSTGTVSGYSYVGGLVGDNYYGSISNCYSTGSVSGTSGDSSFVGGLVGENYVGSISNCYSTGAVGGSGSSYVGGLVGHNYSSSISNCYSTGAVSGYSKVGGLVGRTAGGSISNCYSTGAVSGGSGSSYIGGLVGLNAAGSIINCYSTGAVSVISVSGSSYVGGLVGSNSSDSSISNCYSTGTVSGGSDSDSYYVGGLVGWNFSSISNCYSTGAVSGSYYVGGLVGGNSGGVVSSFWDTETSGQMTSDGGTGKTTAEMKTLSTFTDEGWDFTNETANGTNDYWRMCVNGVDYPRLNWESIAGDFACPDGIDFIDFAIFANAWLSDPVQVNWNPHCDIAEPPDSIIDILDLAIFAQHWLEGL